MLIVPVEFLVVVNQPTTSCNTIYSFNRSPVNRIHNRTEFVELIICDKSVLQHAAI